MDLGSNAKSTDELESNVILPVLELQYSTISDGSEGFNKKIQCKILM